MTDLTLGLSVALVGMLGTLVALSLLAVLIAVLYRAFPVVEVQSPESGVPSQEAAATQTRDSGPGTRG